MTLFVVNNNKIFKVGNYLIPESVGVFIYLK